MKDGLTYPLDISPGEGNAYLLKFTPHVAISIGASLALFTILMIPRNATSVLLMTALVRSATPKDLRLYKFMMPVNFVACTFAMYGYMFSIVLRNSNLQEIMMEIDIDQQTKDGLSKGFSKESIKENVLKTNHKLHKNEEIAFIFEEKWANNCKLFIDSNDNNSDGDS
jgi:hypothetical protein